MYGNNFLTTYGDDIRLVSLFSIIMMGLYSMISDPLENMK